MADTENAPVMSSRDAFEAWVRRTHPKLWPNPGADGQWHKNGAYFNRALQNMWNAWQAGAFAERFELAGVTEHLRIAREDIAKLESRIYQLNAASGKTGPT